MHLPMEDDANHASRPEEALDAREENLFDNNAVVLRAGHTERDLR